MIERFVKMRSCGKDLSIDNYDQISIIAVVAAVHLDMFVCEQVHRFREIYRLNREVNVKNLMSAVRLRQKCHQLDDSNSMLLAYKNSLQVGVLTISYNMHGHVINHIRCNELE